MSRIEIPQIAKMGYNGIARREVRSETFGDEVEEELEREVSTVGANKVVKRLIESVGVGEICCRGSSQASEEL